jgi:hypothetical protein
MPAAWLLLPDIVCLCPRDERPIAIAATSRAPIAQSAEHPEGKPCVAGDLRRAQLRPPADPPAQRLYSTQQRASSFPSPSFPVHGPPPPADQPPRCPVPTHKALSAGRRACTAAVATTVVARPRQCHRAASAARGRAKEGHPSQSLHMVRSMPGERLVLVAAIQLFVGCHGVPHNDAYTNYQQSAICAPSDNAGDCAALRAFGVALGWQSWQSKDNWMTDASICTWFGIACTNGRLTNIHFQFGSDPGMVGYLPPQLSQATALEELYLETADLSRQAEGFPAVVSKMLSLRILSLAGSNVRGTIPAEIGNLQNLTKLFLNDNQLAGAVPPSIGRLQLLESLDLAGNSLTDMPIEFCSLPFSFFANSSSYCGYHSYEDDSLGHGNAFQCPMPYCVSTCSSTTSKCTYKCP